jgi:hypothetical protein
MSFWKELLDLGKELVIAFVKFWLTLLEDLHSFRNKLILVSTLLCLYTINKEQSNEVIIAALGIWNMIIAYYFKKRNESKQMELNAEVEEEAIEE